MSTNPPSPESENPLPKLAQVLNSIDENAPSARANETSISDNNGGRIELDGKIPKRK